ncbi:MAG: multicopper oxidase domain-containing protein [Nitrospira sp.]|uniref:Copper-containing nitrite reductase n=1 Tax=Nitrospira defluvii TaxID=330214 RepID=A0ABM8QTF6_9BACT|nr:multicopper oxidase domain-containing protein [Nitrospira defluvii]MCS6329718.1 multicopper oxidase domain-containing protein [Nitrospira sp.]CAE6714423.1 Copper-containing nitrite reductase [Nitrospira defluvii]
MTGCNTRFRQSVIRTVLGLAAVSGLAMQPVESAFAKVVEVSMTAVETKLVIDGEGHTYDAWTFNGQFPGPVIRVQEGDEVVFSLTNPETNGRPHSMDFHAAETNFLEHYKEVRPGESLQYRFKAKWPGIFAYHCGASPMIQHIARGMMGAIIVDPKDPKALPKADREYVLVQSELFKDPDDADAMFDRKYQHVVFNGSVFRYDPVHSKAGGDFLDAKPGERVRFYFVNAGPNNVSAVHPIAEIWDDVWESGNPANHTRGVQTQLIPPAGAAILDMVLDNNDGVYPIVTHSLTDALRGAIALLKVDKDARQLPLMPLVTPAK